MLIDDINIPKASLPQVWKPVEKDDFNAVCDDPVAIVFRAGVIWSKYVDKSRALPRMRCLFCIPLNEKGYCEFCYWYTSEAICYHGQFFGCLLAVILPICIITDLIEHNNAQFYSCQHTFLHTDGGMSKIVMKFRFEIVPL